MKSVPPTQESLPLPPVADPVHACLTADAKAAAKTTSKVIDLNQWKARSIETDQSALINAVRQRAAHLADVMPPRSKR